MSALPNEVTLKLALEKQDLELKKLKEISLAQLNPESDPQGYQLGLLLFRNDTENFETKSFTERNQVLLRLHSSLELKTKPLTGKDPFEVVEFEKYFHQLNIKSSEDQEQELKRLAEKFFKLNNSICKQIFNEKKRNFDLKTCAFNLRNTILINLHALYDHNVSNTMENTAPSTVPQFERSKQDKDLNDWKEQILAQLYQRRECEMVSQFELITRNFGSKSIQERKLILAEVQGLYAEEALKTELHVAYERLNTINTLKV